MNKLVVNQLLQPFFLLKVGFIIVFVLLSIFSFVIGNQVRVMNRVVTEKGSSAIVAFIATGNVIVSLALIFAALVIL